MTTCTKAAPFLFLLTEVRDLFGPSNFRSRNKATELLDATYFSTESCKGSAATLQHATVVKPQQ
jgi:hypothetical protein